MIRARGARVYRAAMDDASRHPKYDVIGYRESLEDEDIDPDPSFREFLRIINDRMKVRTVSSCQGHKPGEKYPDVQQPMSPYVTIHGDTEELRAASKTLRSLPSVSSVRVEGKKALVRMRPGTTDNWEAVLGELRRRLEQ